jgi:hypothetical protein
MAYVQNKELKTRIALKYDSYANWRTNNPVLLKGEVAIATVETSDTDQSFTNLPNTVIKVGNGSAHYNDLPFLSALAADVHSWAKAAVKPSYEAKEIVGLQDYIEKISDIDTDTQYRIVPVEGATYKYQLESKSLTGAWTPVAENGLIDISDADNRLDNVEAILAKAGLGADGKDVASMIAEAIAGLDSEKGQTAGADGLALNVKIENGLLTSVSGSIAPNTYDAYGAAAAVQGETTHTVAEAYALADAAQTAEEVAAAVKKEEDARVAAIQALDYTAYEAGSATGATISFVGEISETDGIIAATKRDLKFQSAYDPENNKAATMADVTSAVADLNGAMHFEGVVTFNPADYAKETHGEYAAGDVVMFAGGEAGQYIEYVFDGTKFIQLGDESLAGRLIAALDMTQMDVAASETVKFIAQNDGKVSAEKQSIKIAEDQVTGLVEDLASKATNAALKAATDDIADLQEAIKDITGVEGDGPITSIPELIENAVNALDKPDTAVEGQYVSAVSQADGIITVTRAALPVIPDVEVAQGAVTPESGEVAVVTGVEVDANNKHKLNVARSTAITAAAVNAKIQALDATIAASSDKHVLTGITETDGVLTGKTEVALADVAFSGNVKDLVQTAETYVLFNCGTSSDVIDAQ